MMKNQVPEQPEHKEDGEAPVKDGTKERGGGAGAAGACPLPVSFVPSLYRGLQ